MHGTDPLEARAAEYLYENWGEQWEAGFHAPVSASNWSGEYPAIFIGTPETHAAIQEEHQGHPFELKPEEKESYHLVFRDGSAGISNLWIVGSHSKGAMNGVPADGSQDHREPHV